MNWHNLLACLIVYFSVNGLQATLLSERGIYPEKEEQCKSFVEKGFDFFEKHTVSESANAFMHDPSFRINGMFIILISHDGTIYTFGDELHLILTNFKDMSKKSTKVFEDLLMVSSEGSWFTILHNNSLMHGYVKPVSKNGETYLILAGFYPDSPELRIKYLVQKAIDVLKTEDLAKVFEQINDPNGPFVMGDIHVIVTGEDGREYASAKRIWRGSDVYDAKSIYVISKADLRDFFKSKKQHDWFDSESYRTKTKAYIRKFVDPKSRKTYAVMAYHFPEFNDDNSVKQLVRDASIYLKLAGRERAFKEFNHVHGKFSVGGMRIFAFSDDGTVLANGEDPGLVGLNFYDRTNEEGRKLFKTIIDHALQYGSSWYSNLHHNAYQSIYAERVELPDGVIVLGSGYWPSLKEAVVNIMVLRAHDTIEREGLDIVIRRATSMGSDYLRGDVTLKIETAQGVVLVDGPFKKFNIWDSSKVKTGTKNKNGGWATVRDQFGQRRIFSKTVTIKVNGKPQSLMLSAGYYE